MVSSINKCLRYCFAALFIIAYIVPISQYFVDEKIKRFKGKNVHNSHPELRNKKIKYANIPGIEENNAALYFVESRHCKIPYVNPFDAEVSAIYKPMVFESCSNESTLVTPIYNKATRRYVLHINESLATLLLNSSIDSYNCFYQEVVRNREHDSFGVTKPKLFSQGFVVPHHVQGMLTSCFRKGNIRDSLQSDAFSLIQHKRAPAGKQIFKDSATRKPSVIMFGIDSLSRINLRRTMPKVFRFLNRKGWYEMQGYTKIADNTFPNLMGFLTGHSLQSAKNICDWREKGCLDRYPFVWKRFQEAGYLTAYAEDETDIGTFNLFPAGFIKQPTDYYQRPNHRAFEAILPNWKCADCAMRYCIGRRITSSYVYDFGKEFVRRYIDERPTWSLMWSNSFSHDDFRMPSKMQDFVLQYLLDFQADGVFEKSIVIFLADHGCRSGKLMNLTSAFLESRLPAMFIYLPPWFRTQYPEYARALHQNQRRLTSNYDLYNTLMHIIQLGDDKIKTAPRAASCPKCRSLFEPVDEDRTCKDAGIPDHYCTCNPFKRITANWAQRFAPLVINRINNYLANRHLSGICAKLTLSQVYSTDMKIDLEKSYHGENPQEVAVYRTFFKVEQSSAEFEATVVFNSVTQSVEVDMPSISRTSLYAKTSECVVDKIDKLFCICKV